MFSFVELGLNLELDNGQANKYYGTELVPQSCFKKMIYLVIFMGMCECLHPCICNTHVPGA